MDGKKKRIEIKPFSFSEEEGDLHIHLYSDQPGVVISDAIDMLIKTNIKLDKDDKRKTEIQIEVNQILTELQKKIDEYNAAEKQTTIEESGRLKHIITDIFLDNKRILQLESYLFEEVVAELLRSQGFHVDMTKRTRDGGFDLMAISQLNGNFPLKFLVECKRYTEDKIGIDVVRQLMYVVDKEKANKGIIATTSYFTRDVKWKNKTFFRIC